jgi:hypothetical protein
MDVLKDGRWRYGVDSQSDLCFLLAVQTSREGPGMGVGGNSATNSSVATRDGRERVCVVQLVAAGTDGETGGG